MKHGRPDYDKRIQDSARIIPANEPVFLLRAQDTAAVAAIMTWASLAAVQGAADDVIEGALEQAQSMMRWRAEHGGSMKVADLPG